MSYTGRIDIRAIALDALHHGAGTQGNTVVLRRQEVLQANGEIDTVPFISGNSIRHMIRDAGVRYALEAMAVPEGTLSKAVVDLLFSGGSLTSKGSMTLEKARRIAELFPILPVLGYSAGSRITGGRLEVANLHLVCSQNQHRKPEGLIAADAHRWGVDASAQTSTEFGTRHDAARITHAAAYLALPPASPAPSDGKKKPKPEDSTQMIYEWETIMPGAEFFGSIGYRGLKEAELAALVSALSHGCEGRHSDGGYLYLVGAKRGTGHGRMSWHFHGLARPLASPTMETSDRALPALVEDQHASRLDAYREHLATQREAILRELEEIAA